MAPMDRIETLEATAIPAARPVVVRADRSAQRLLSQLCELYAAERHLALELPQLVRRTDSIPMHLVLSDQRKAASRQIIRLELMIQTVTGDAGAKVSASQAGGASRSDTPVLGVHLEAVEETVLAGPLRAARGAMGPYRAAIGLARRLGQISIAELLSESLREKQATIVVLSELAERDRIEGV